MDWWYEFISYHGYHWLWHISVWMPCSSTCLVALERLEKVTLSPTAWVCPYESMEAADDTCVPECTDGFMTIIAGISGKWEGGEERGGN